MVIPKGRFAAALLAGLLVLSPSAAPAQCQHSSNPSQTGMSQMGQGRSMGGMMSQMSSMNSMRMQTPLMQPLQMLWLLMQQQEQTQLRQTQLTAMQQTPAPRLTQTAAPRLGPSQKKQVGALLQQMQALDQRMTGLEEAALRNELRAPEAAAVQNDVNALQSQVDALAKAPGAVLDQMSSLHRRTDDLLDKVAAKPVDLIAALHNSR